MSCEYYSYDNEPEIIGKSDELIAFTRYIGYLNETGLLNESFITITNTSDNGFVYSNYYNGDNENSDADIIIIKRNSYGEKVWEYVFSKPDNQVINIRHLMESENGSILLSGGINISDHITKPLLLKLNFDGKFIWERIYSINGSGTANGMNLTDDGGFIICGTKSKNGDKGFVIKTDANGFLEWKNTYCEDGAKTEANSIIQIKTGYYLSLTSNDEGIGYTLDKKGKIVHASHMPSDYSRVHIIKANDGGHVILNINCKRSIIGLLKFDDLGKTIWQTNLNNNSNLELNYKAIKPIHDIGYFVIYEKDSENIIHIINNSGELV
jgi:hypothetical protein